jgi:hypothetical protein
VRRTLDNEAVQAARLLIASGFTIGEAANKLGVSYEALKRRHSREKWLNPKRAAKAADKKIIERATEITADSLADQAREYQRRLSNVAARFSASAEQMDSDELLKAARAIETLDRVSRRTLGLDDQEKPNPNAVNWAILGDFDISRTTDIVTGPLLTLEEVTSAPQHTAPHDGQSLSTTQH